MTTCTAVVNKGSECFVEVTVYAKVPRGVNPDNAKDYGLERKLHQIGDIWATVVTNFRLAPGQSMEVWIHDFQFYVVTEV